MILEPCQGQCPHGGCGECRLAWCRVPMMEPGIPLGDRSTVSPLCQGCYDTLDVARVEWHLHRTLAGWKLDPASTTLDDLQAIDRQLVQAVSHLRARKAEETGTETEPTGAINALLHHAIDSLAWHLRGLGNAGQPINQPLETVAEFDPRMKFRVILQLLPDPGPLEQMPPTTMH